MHHPVAGIIGDKGDLGNPARRHIDCVAPDSMWRALTVDVQDPKMVAVEMHRMGKGGLVAGCRSGKICPGPS